jgi:DNA-binding NarL/FixJ family response regulator
MKILIADDSELLRDRIKESLKDINEIEIVGEAKNGIEAINIIKEQKPDFILLDLRMPELNGFEVLKKIKENGYKPKVCIYTNYAYTQYKKRCISEGADYFFDKNSDFQEVKNLISELAVKIPGLNNYQSK